MMAELTSRTKRIWCLRTSLNGKCIIAQQELGVFYFSFLAQFYLYNLLGKEGASENAVSSLALSTIERVCVPVNNLSQTHLCNLYFFFNVSICPHPIWRETFSSTL